MNSTPFPEWGIAEFNTNKTKSSSALTDYYIRVLVHFGKAEAVIAFVGIVSNLFIIVTLLSSKTLRREFRPIQIMSMALSDLIIMAFFCPERAHLGISEQKEIIYSCNFQLLLFFFEAFIQHFVSTWGVMCVNTAYLLKIIGNRLPPMSPWKRRLLVGILVAVPWLSTAITMPAANKNEGLKHIKDTYCMFLMEPIPSTIVCVATYFIPVAVALVEGAVMAALFFKNPGLDREESPWAYIGAALLMLLVLPEILNDMVVRLFRGRQEINYLAVATVLADIKCAVLPFIWFLNPRIRQAFKELYGCHACQRTEPEEEVGATVTYKKIDSQC